MTLAILAISFLPYFEAKNTAANYVLHPPEAGREELKIEKPSFLHTERCHYCEGTGKLSLQIPDFGQDKGRIGTKKTLNTSCKFCSGSGKIKSFSCTNEAFMLIAADFERFKTKHQAAGDMPVGEAFVHHDDFQTLSNDQKKLIASIFGKPCRKCKWSGLEDCKKCHGSGELRCPNSSCKQGFDVTETTSSYTRRNSGNHSFSRSGSFSGRNSSTTISRKDVKVNLCSDCGGLGKIKCPECLGMKASPCRACNGNGAQTK